LAEDIMRALIAALSLCTPLCTLAAAGYDMALTNVHVSVTDLNPDDGIAPVISASPSEIESFVTGMGVPGGGSLDGTITPYTRVTITFDLAVLLWYTDVAGASVWLQSSAEDWVPDVGPGAGFGIDTLYGAGWDYRHYDGSYHSVSSGWSPSFDFENPFDRPNTFSISYGTVATIFDGDPTQPEPIPEPSTYLLMLAGLAFIGLRHAPTVPARRT